MKELLAKVLLHLEDDFVNHAQLNSDVEDYFSISMESWIVSAVCDESVHHIYKDVFLALQKLNEEK